MRLAIRTVGETTVIEVTGALVGRRAADVFQMNVGRCAGRGRPVVVDLTGVTSIDVDGLNALGGVHAARAGGEGCGVRLTGVAESLSDLVVIVRLLTAFEVYESVEAALGVSSGRFRPRCRFLSAQPTSTTWTGAASAAGARPH